MKRLTVRRRFGEWRRMTMFRIRRLWRGEGWWCVTVPLLIARVTFSLSRHEGFPLEGQWVYTSTFPFTTSLGFHIERRARRHNVEVAGCVVDSDCWRHVWSKTVVVSRWKYRVLGDQQWARS